MVTNEELKPERAMLIAAVESGDLAQVQALCSQGVNLNAENDWPVCLLRRAALYGHLPIIQWLLLDLHEDFYLNDPFVLPVAAQEGHLSVVQYLFSMGADFHADQENALRNAAYKGHLPVVQYLVEQGANLHSQKEEALCHAARNDHFHVVQYLVDQGANLQKAIKVISAGREKGRTELLQWLDELQKSHEEKRVLTLEMDSIPVITTRPHSRL